MSQFSARSKSGGGYSRSRFRFGQFELDRDARELWRDGRKVPLQQQPFQILELLVTRAGEVVTREEIRQAVWPDDSHGQFDAGVGNAVRKIRVALGDDADNARFLETIPKQGFRFIAPVSLVMPPQPEPVPAAPMPQAPAVVGLPELPVPLGVPRKRYWLAGVIGLAVTAAAGVVWLAAPPQPPSLQGVRPLAALGGRPTHPSLSPNGELLAFDWDGPDDDQTAIYIQRLESTSPVRLTSGKQPDFWPVWSPDGKQLAFLRETAPNLASAFLIPVVGVGERVLFEVEKGNGEKPRLSWSPDGKWLATAERKRPVGGKRQASTILVYSIETGERRTITHPPPDWRGDSEPTFSPDSRAVAFRRTRPTSADEDIFTVPLAGGEPTPVTADRVGVAALVFSADGGIIYSSRRGGGVRNLWWMPPRGGEPKLLSDPAFDLGSPAISRDGKHLAYVKVQYDVNLWRLSSEGGKPAGVSPSEFIESNPSFSPDGSRIAFVSGRTGKLEVWVSGVSGAGAVQLTAAEGAVVAVPQWSPDGKQIAYEWRPKGREGIYVIPSSGGVPKAIVTGANGESIPRWSRDGRFLYFNSNRSGHQEVWRAPVDGGDAVQMTRDGGCSGTESADRGLLYYAKPGRKGLWTATLQAGLLSGAEKMVVPDLIPEDCGNWALATDRILYIRRSAENRYRGKIVSLQLATGISTEIYTLPAPPVWNASGLAVSPDGKSILFAEVDRDGTSIYGR